MNQAVYNMLTRRSVRLYKQEQITDCELKVLIECALYAPCGGSSQTARLLVLQDPTMMAQLNVLIRDELSSRELTGGRPIDHGIVRARTANYHFIYNAPTLIVAVAPKTWDNAMADCTCMIENILLAAPAIGLGACWSNQPHWLTDLPSLREIFTRIGLREDEDIFAGASIGYAAFVPKNAPARKADRVDLDRPRELDDSLLRELLC